MEVLNFTNEEMTRMMRPGLRVIRSSTDWYPAGSSFENEDGNCLGTVVGKYLESEFGNVWEVKWDNTGKTHHHLMGGSRTENGEIKYRLKIVGFGSPQKTLGNKLSMSKNTFDLKIICQDKIIDCHKSVICCQSDVFE